jgi:hypothetical protein
MLGLRGDSWFVRGGVGVATLSLAVTAFADMQQLEELDPWDPIEVWEPIEELPYEVLVLEADVQPGPKLIPEDIEFAIPQQLRMRKPTVIITAPDNVTPVHVQTCELGANVADCLGDALFDLEVDEDTFHRFIRGAAVLYDPAESEYAEPGEVYEYVDLYIYSDLLLRAEQ